MSALVTRFAVLVWAVMKDRLRTMNRNTLQIRLKREWYFDCDCNACHDDKYAELDRQLAALYCQSCSDGLIVKATDDTKCPKCGAVMHDYDEVMAKLEAFEDRLIKLQESGKESVECVSAQR